MLNQIVSIIEKVDIEPPAPGAGGQRLLDDEITPNTPLNNTVETPQRPTTGTTTTRSTASEEEVELTAASVTERHGTPVPVHDASVVIDIMPEKNSVKNTPAYEVNATGEMYLAKAAELEEVLRKFGEFQAYAMSCFDSYQSQLDKHGHGEATDGLLGQIRGYEMPALKKSMEEVRHWADGVRREVAVEEVEGRNRVLTGHLQSTVASLREVEAEKRTLEDAVKGLKEDLLVKEEVLPPPILGETDVAKLKAKVMRASNELSEKQAMLSAVYNEKEELRNRLEMVTSKLELASTLPRSQVDESKFFQSLSGRGQWGARITTTASRIDWYTMRLGTFLYTNAVLRVLIAMYLILIHLWVFYVITSYVHMLPHLPQNVHDHVGGGD